MLDFTDEMCYNCSPLMEGAETVVTKCPVCAGTGKVLDKYVRHVHFGDGLHSEVSCWMCGGKGSVEEVPATKRMHIRKYYNYDAEKDGDFGEGLYSYDAGANTNVD